MSALVFSYRLRLRVLLRYWCAVALLVGSLPMALFADNTHPVHLSVCEIRHNPKGNTLEIALKIFYDDLEEAIEKMYGIKLYLATPKEPADKADQLIRRYIEARFGLHANRKPLIPQYVGREYEEDAVWVYYEIPNVPPSGEIRLSHSLLTDIFDDQNNLVHWYGTQGKQSLRFTAAQTQHTWAY